MVTPMAMTKTQIYFPPGELRALHRVARQEKRKVADLVREAVREKWLKALPQGPVALFSGKGRRGSSTDHDWVFDEL